MLSSESASQEEQRSVAPSSYGCEKWNCYRTKNIHVQVELTTVSSAMFPDKIGRYNGQSGKVLSLGQLYR